MSKPDFSMSGVRDNTEQGEGVARPPRADQHNILMTRLQQDTGWLDKRAAAAE